MSKKPKKDLKAEYERQGKIAALEEKKARAKANRQEMEAVLDPSINDDSSTSDKELGEWTELRKYIMIHFPQAKDHTNLSANQIMTGVATAMGWTVAKISESSGITKRTIYNWVNKPEVQYLIQEFAIKEGQTDPKKMMKSIGYKALKLIDHILSVTPDLNNKDLLKLQQDTAKFQIQQSYGKAEENINVKTVDFKDIAEQVHLQKSNTDTDLSEEEEEELFLN